MVNSASKEKSTMKKLCATIFFFFPMLLYSQEANQHILVHFYPHSLSPQDVLQDGPGGKKLDIREDTFLVWVDLYPGLFFTHETSYLFISKEGVRIERGDWWPVLNGKMILHNEYDQFALLSPYELPLISMDGYLDEHISIHIYPHEINSQDHLNDGPFERLFKIENNCLLLWVDFLPGAFFAHPTAYVLISRTNIRVIDGIWWPTLNGQTILYGQSNKIGVLSPFKVKSNGPFLQRARRK
jgi:hypothetical protein